jgi:hypothetical protein
MQVLGAAEESVRMGAEAVADCLAVRLVHGGEWWAALRGLYDPRPATCGPQRTIRGQRAMSAAVDAAMSQVYPLVAEGAFATVVRAALRRVVEALAHALRRAGCLGGGALNAADAAVLRGDLEALAEIFGVELEGDDIADACAPLAKLLAAK